MSLWGKQSERKKKHTECGKYGQIIEIKLENCNEHWWVPNEGVDYVD